MQSVWPNCASEAGAGSSLCAVVNSINNSLSILRQLTSQYTATAREVDVLRMKLAGATGQQGRGQPYAGPGQYRDGYNAPGQYRDGYNAPGQYRDAYNAPGQYRNAYNAPGQYRNAYDRPYDAPERTYNEDTGRPYTKAEVADLREKLRVAEARLAELQGRMDNTGLLETVLTNVNTNMDRLQSIVKPVKVEVPPAFRAADDPNAMEVDSY
jgi:hypothetical protein